MSMHSTLYRMAMQVVVMHPLDPYGVRFEMYVPELFC